MKRTANIATFPPRRVQLLKMLESIKGQFDEVRVYFNNVSDRPKWIPEWVDVYCGEDNNGDLTDNGKFYFLEEGLKDEYYFTLDDDIYYPPTYAEDMVKAIERTGAIVTHHGRILKALNVSYYRGPHKVFACLRANKIETRIDVSGTGVCAFNVNDFNPFNLWSDERQKMSDMIFSEEAARQGKRIVVLKHDKDYFKYLWPDESTTIHQQSFRSCPIQTHIANQIYLFKYGTN